jgi:Kef-type K+ transport system membrane component KefB
MLDYFAFIVLIILIAVVIAAWIMLAMMPGQIAKKRGHPQAEAINVMGWWGALTMGVLAPIAWVWAYTKPVAKPIDLPQPDPDPVPDPDPETNEEVAS